MDIVPHLVLVDNRTDSVMEDGRGLWYNFDRTADLGLAAPVTRLLEQLAAEHGISGCRVN
jgi:hypothetical protein